MKSSFIINKNFLEENFKHEITHVKCINRLFPNGETYENILEQLAKKNYDYTAKWLLDTFKESNEETQITEDVKSNVSLYTCKDLFIDGDLVIDGDVLIAGELYAKNITVRGELYCKGHIHANGNISALNITAHSIYAESIESAFCFVYAEHGVDVRGDINVSCIKSSEIKARNIYSKHQIKASIDIKVSNSIESETSTIKAKNINAEKIKAIREIKIEDTIEAKRIICKSKVSARSIYCESIDAESINTFIINSKIIGTHDFDAGQVVSDKIIAEGNVRVTGYIDTYEIVTGENSAIFVGLSYPQNELGLFGYIKSNKKPENLYYGVWKEIS